MSGLGRCQGVVTALLLLMLTLTIVSAERASLSRVDNLNPRARALASAFVGDANATIDVIANSTTNEVAVGDPEMEEEAVSDPATPRDLAMSVKSASPETNGDNQPLVALQATALLIGGAAAVVLVLAAVSKTTSANKPVTGESLPWLLNQYVVPRLLTVNSPLCLVVSAYCYPDNDDAQMLQSLLGNDADYAAI